MSTERLTPWAQTPPWDCVDPQHDHTPRSGDLCSVPECQSPLRSGEIAYRVTELEGYVCWRHIEGGRAA